MLESQFASDKFSYNSSEYRRGKCFELADTEAPSLPLDRKSSAIESKKLHLHLKALLSVIQLL